MTLLSNAMHHAGLAGVPWRTADPTYGGIVFETPLGAIGELRAQIALGGIVLFLSAMLFLGVVLPSWIDRDAPRATHDPLPAPLSGPEHSPKVIDDLKLWTAIAAVLVICAYALPFTGIVADGGLLGPGIEAVQETLAPIGGDLP